MKGYYLFYSSAPNVPAAA